MSYQIESSLSFDRAVKRLAKKYRHVKQDLRGLVGALMENPFAGDAIPGFAHEVWKIRLASSDMPSGKRGGYRVIYTVNREAEVCYLLFMYAKPERGDITAKEIEALLAELDEQSLV
jgi:mRNA-degrading endonuclease RelE of RelBE toxin-antitoxin system